MKPLFTYPKRSAITTLCGAILLCAIVRSPAYAIKDDISIVNNTKLDLTLRRKLLDAKSTEVVTVIVTAQATAGASDINSIEFRNSLIGMTRQHRYDFVRAHLEARAAETKLTLQPKLDSLVALNEIISYRSHWIINSYTVRLPIAGLQSLTSIQSVSKVILPPKPALISTTPETKTKSYRSTSGDSNTTGTSSVSSNIESVRARAVWSRGFTGKGRIVCSFDTGVDGFHPALRKSWKGLDGDSSAAWFDPVGMTSFPHAFNSVSLPQHGSHTMGIMLGRDTLTGDTIGVAPGARWISAAVIDVPGASIVDAFEWAADPDKDPNTISDVPDVINHSWGAQNSILGCDALFHRLIDNTEALGIVNIFATGNEGRQGEQTIRNPANRALDSIDCFAVGFVDHRTSGQPTISGSSSRGPSDCDGVSVKPNVVAPGVSIRSSVLGGSYGFLSGSSMAAPHVAGIVALLREKNPNASPEQIKTALLTTSSDLGPQGPDNEHGWGYINALAALKALPESTNPVLRVTALTPNLPDNTGLLRAKVRIQNVGENTLMATTVRGTIISTPSSVTIISGSVTFGSIGPDSSATSIENIIIQIDDTLSTGSVIPLDFLIVADDGVRQLERIYILIGDRIDREFYTHRSDRMSFTVSNFGEYGFADDSYTPLGFAGLRFDDDTDDDTRSSLFEMAFMLGLDASHVSDGIRNIGLQPDRDFSPSPGGAFNITSLDTIADIVTFSSFADTLAEAPLGLTIRQRTFGWRHAPLDNVVVIDYTIVNNSGASLGGIYASMFADWDIGSFNLNIGSFDLQNDLGYMAFIDTEEDIEMYRGIAVLSAKGLTGHYVQDMSVFGNLRNPFTESLKYNAMTSGFAKATVFEQGDLAHFVTTGPYSIGSGDSTHVSFAIVAGYSLTELQTAVTTVRSRLDSVLTAGEVPGSTLPTEFRLEQNFPNPFNPTTEIQYALEAPGRVNLSIYNVLGQKVIELVNQWQERDVYTAKWNGIDEDGASVASGMYFYRLKRGEQTLTRKMILLK